jgi:hypothetical protein
MKIKYNLKYGLEGLFMNVYNKRGKLGTLMVSQDYPKIYKFLGLDYTKWEQGFDELEDIFEFIATSKFFNWKMFQFDQLNKINRDRNKKRKSYMSFLEWMDKNVADTAHEYQFTEDKTSYFDMINEFFPEADLVTQTRRLEYEECKKLYLQSKFNGGQVMLKFGLEGKELGDAMTNFKKHIESTFYTSFDDWAINKSSDLIYAFFKAYIKTHEVSK